MDQLTRQMIDEAYALDDEAREYCERSPGVEKRYSGGLIYKVKHDALPVRPVVPAPQSEVTEEFVVNFVECATEIIGDETHRLVGEETAKLRAEIAELRCEIEVLRATNVKPLRTTKDAA